jgi:GR25 family glycosyltransferase involved in LPS biosynthesis
MQHIAHIFYINLEKRTDRFAQINAEFATSGILRTHTPERFDAIPTPGFGILGCTLSHCEVLKLAKEREYSNVLIFEDDFMFLVGEEEWNRYIFDIFKIGVVFDVIMFSYNVKETMRDNGTYPLLTKVLNASTASCYLVNGHYFDTLIDLYTDAIPRLEETRRHWEWANDAVWTKLMCRDDWYITNVRLGKQRPSFSDNSMEFMDHGC